MLFWILMWPLLIFQGIFVLRFVITIAISRYNPEFYRKQGMKTYFSPFLGQFNLFTKQYEENKESSDLQYIKKLISKDDDTGVLAANMLMAALRLHCSYTTANR